MNIHLSSYGQGVPLVFFHGWGFDSQIWRPLVPLLGAHYQLIFVDLPGFGLSAIMDWSLFQAELLKLLPQNFHVIGWSLGGLYAMRLAIEAPENVRSLLAITSSPHFLADENWPGISREVFARFYKKLSLNTKDTLNEFMRLQLNSNQVPISLGMLPSQAGLDHGLMVLDTWDLREELKQLQQKACFLFSKHDAIVPATLMPHMQNIYPNFSYYLFPKAGHMPFLSHRTLFVDELLRFFS